MSSIYKCLKKKRNLEINGWTKLGKDGAQKTLTEIYNFYPPDSLKGQTLPCVLNDGCMETKKITIHHCLVGVEVGKCPIPFRTLTKHL